MIEIIIYLAIGLVLGGLILYLCLRPRLRQVAQKNEDILDYNRSLRAECDEVKHHLSDLYDQKHDLNQEIDFLNAEKEKAHSAYLILRTESETIKNSIEDLKEQASQSAKIFEEQAISLAQSNIEQSLEKLGAQYEAAEQEYLREYQDILAICAADLQEKLANDNEAIAETKKILNELIAKTQSAVEAAKRAEEIRAAADFYKLQLSEVDLQEIEMLRNVAPYLRDKEPLNKVIWKCYYEKPTTDLIGRVIGSGVHTGIYKITNLTNEMCYIGQAANLADRWKQHIKRGVGADTPTRNKLYPAMVAFGPESFSFEVIEECDRSLLDEREDYWQDYFKAKEFGYSIK